MISWKLLEVSVTVQSLAAAATDIFPSVAYGDDRFKVIRGLCAHPQNSSDSQLTW